MATKPNSGVAGEHTPLIHPECATDSVAAQNIKTFSDDANKKDARGFLFDVIILRLDMINKTIDQSNKLLVDTNFNGKNLSITSSRINVLDFIPERGIEFMANPLELKQQLSQNPLTVKVTDVTDVIGYGSLEWPKEFLSGLVDCDEEMKKCFEIELKKCDGTKIGAMHIIVRLQPKCKEYEEHNSPDGKCGNGNKEIEANDVLFMVSEETNDCCCNQIGIIPASESNHDLQPKCLDLSNFRAVNSQNVDKPDTLASLDAECQRLLTVTNHYQKLIDTKKKEFPYKEKSKIFDTLTNYSCSQMNVLPTTSDYRIPEHSPSDNRAFSAKTMNMAPMENPIPIELIENEPQTFRKCPLCKENMEYLPKLAACPNCCYKPIPYFKEKPYDDSKSAYQTLEAFYEKLQANDTSESDTNTKDLSKCRCTCKYGSDKPCAHCRIRKLCENIFQPPATTFKSADICEPKSSDVHCVSSNDNRPFLTRIFSELKDMFEIEEPKKKEIEVNERCERELNKKPAKMNQLPMKKEIKTTTKTNETKEISEPQKPRKRKIRCIKPGSELAMRSKLYDYQFVKHNFPTKSSYKPCINDSKGHKNVPPNMGWLWNINNSEKWKPGAIRKPIKELMRYFLKDFPADTIVVSQYSRRKVPNSGNVGRLKPVVQKPTLHIQKKNGEYIITMRPLKCREFLKDSVDPYENMRPIQFRIVQNPQLRKIRNLKKSLKSMGFKKCTCHRPFMYCYCRSFLDKMRLEYQCKKECCKFQMEPCCDTLVLSDTSDSEAEFDFAVTPPVALIKPEKLKSDLIHVGTQYDELDWNPVPLFPRPPNKYMQMYHCAVGDRKARPITFGDGDGGVFGADTAYGSGSGFAGGTGGGDGFVKMKAIDFSGGYGGRGPGGLRGPSGPAGITGPTRSGGLRGPSVPVGLRGSSGPGGLRSPSGRTGPGGFRGPAGFRGPSEPGVLGGPSSPGGLSGPSGPGGFKGPVGLRGPGGFRGPVGLTGPSGPGVLGGPGRLRGPGGLTGPSVPGMIGGPGVPGGLRGPGAPADYRIPRGIPHKNGTATMRTKKIDMFKYIMLSKKKEAKMSAADAANKRKEKMKLLRGANPPLLCMIDRLGKPVDPCDPCQPCRDYRIC